MSASPEMMALQQEIARLKAENHRLRVVGAKRGGSIKGKVAYSKAKGRGAEKQVAQYLVESGWPHAERRAKNGNRDRGDIAGIAGLVVEVKDEVRIDLPGYIRELDVEVRNAAGRMGIVVVKKRQCLDVGEWYGVMPMRLMVKLLKQAGY